MVGTNPNCPHMFHRACESVAQSLDGQRSHIRSFPPLSPQSTQQGSQPKQPVIYCLAGGGAAALLAVLQWLEIPQTKLSVLSKKVYLAVEFSKTM